MTSLLLYGTDTEYRLSPDQREFTIGSATDRDIVIEGHFVSAHHCRLDRRSSQLEVTDEGSKNGTYFEGEREPTFYLKPGKTFIVGALPHRFLALNDEMRALYPALIDILGDENEHVIRAETPSPSDLIIAAVHGAHMLITSEPGCDQDRLARIIHAMSRFRTRPMVEIDTIPEERVKQSDLVKRAAARSTLLLALPHDARPIDPTFVSTLFSTSYQLRVIVLARTVDIARKALGEQQLRAMQHISLRPLALRSEAIPRLLDRMFAERQSPLRVAMLTPDNQNALRAHQWPNNLASLRHAADCLTALASCGSIPKAAAALGIPRATFYHWYSQIVGLSRPLTYMWPRRRD